MELFDEENAYTALADQWENYGTLRSTFGRLQGKNYIRTSDVKALPTPRWSVVSCFVRYSR